MAANQRWAQCCVRFNLVNISVFDLPDALLEEDGKLLILDEKNKYEMSQSVYDIIRKGGASPAATAPTVTAYFTGQFKKKASGVAFPPFSFKVAADWARFLKLDPPPEKDKRLDPALANVLFIGAPYVENHFTLAHELGHILVNTNDPIPAPLGATDILFPDNIPSEGPNLVGSDKRLPTSVPGSEPTIPLHKHLTGIKAKGQNTFEDVIVEYKNFNVCQHARTTRGKPLTDLGNNVLQKK